MEPTLKVDFYDVKRFIEWSLFIEEGAVDFDPKDPYPGISTVERCEIDLGNKLLTIYKKMKKAKEKETELYYELSHNQAEIIRSWYHRVPEVLSGEDDADMHAKLSLFVVGGGC